MFSEKIKNAIRIDAEKISSQNPFFQRAAQGLITEKEIKSYLYNIYHLIQQTPPCLERAITRSRETGNAELTQFFLSKKMEETGHDLWAKDDLSKFGEKAPDTVATQDLSPAMKELTRYIHGLIEEDPRYYLIYMLYAEYFTVLTAPAFLEHLAQYCNIPREKMTAIAHHEELDRDHVADDLDIIQTHIPNPANEDQFLRVVSSTSHLVNDFLTGLVRES